MRGGSARSCRLSRENPLLNYEFACKKCWPLIANRRPLLQREVRSNMGWLFVLRYFLSGTPQHDSSFGWQGPLFLSRGDSGLCSPVARRFTCPEHFPVVPQRRRKQRLGNRVQDLVLAEIY